MLLCLEEQKKIISIKLSQALPQGSAKINQSHTQKLLLNPNSTIYQISNLGKVTKPNWTDAVDSFIKLSPSKNQKSCWKKCQRCSLPSFLHVFFPWSMPKFWGWMMHAYTWMMYLMLSNPSFFPTFQSAYEESFPNPRTLWEWRICVLGISVTSAKS